MTGSPPAEGHSIQDLFLPSKRSCRPPSGTCLPLNRAHRRGSYQNIHENTEPAYPEIPRSQKRFLLLPVPDFSLGPVLCWQRYRWSIEVRFPSALQGVQWISLRAQRRGREHGLRELWGDFQPVPLPTAPECRKDLSDKADGPRTRLYSP